MCFLLFFWVYDGCLGDEQLETLVDCPCSERNCCLTKLRVEQTFKSDPSVGFWMSYDASRSLNGFMRAALFL